MTLAGPLAVGRLQELSALSAAAHSRLHLHLHPQAVIIPIVKKEEDRVQVNQAAQRLAAEAKEAGFRVKVGRLIIHAKEGG